MMKSSATATSNSGAAGLKEFGDGDAALFNGTTDVIDHQSFRESEDDFEAEFHRILTEAISIELEINDFNGNNETLMSSFDDSAAFYPISPSNCCEIPTPQLSTTQEIKFEEDPLSAVLNYQEQQKLSSKREKKRGRPPLIKFKSVSVNKPTLVLPHPSEKDRCHLQMRDRRSDSDFYSPVWIRGRGVEREGLCPLCEPPVWLKIKQSAYWYHMNFFHGISAATGRPYKRPISYRYTQEISSSSFKVDGHCGNCLQWIHLATDYTGNTISEVVERSICFTSWFKHAQKCHYRAKEFNIPKDF